MLSCDLQQTLGQGFDHTVITSIDGFGTFGDYIVGSGQDAQYTTVLDIPDADDMFGVGYTQSTVSEYVGGWTGLLGMSLVGLYYDQVGFIERIGNDVQLGTNSWDIKQNKISIRS